MALETDIAIAARFPVEWARANDVRLRNRSKARNNLRRRYRLTVELEAFVAENPLASCGNCANATENPGMLKGLACDIDSDVHGYQMVDPAHVCTRWHAATRPQGTLPHASHQGVTTSVPDNSLTTRAEAGVSTDHAK